MAVGLRRAVVVTVLHEDEDSRCAMARGEVPVRRVKGGERRIRVKEVERKKHERRNSRRQMKWGDRRGGGGGGGRGGGGEGYEKRWYVECSTGNWRND